MIKSHRRYKYNAYSEQVVIYTEKINIIEIAPAPSPTRRDPSSLQGQLEPTQSRRRRLYPRDSKSPRQIQVVKWKGRDENWLATRTFHHKNATSATKNMSSNNESNKMRATGLMSKNTVMISLSAYNECGRDSVHGRDEKGQLAGFMRGDGLYG
jgi:hypothetical protein